jgi:hypothetical protein
LQKLSIHRGGWQLAKIALFRTAVNSLEAVASEGHKALPISPGDLAVRGLLT